MAFHVINEARRCLQCKKPICREKGCPVHTNIPEMIRLFLDGRINDAGSMLFENNPLSIMCSLVCDHEKQCEGNCIQGKKGGPVHISSIENYISDAYLDKMILERDRKKHQNVAIIGSGPAGLTAAVILAQKGYDITIFESKDHIGGMLRYGIPDFRLPKTILHRFKMKLLQLGIRIRPNTTIGGALHLDDLMADGYEAILIGTGVWRPRRLGVRGESLGNVHYAIDYLRNPDAYHLGDRVAVIGAGNSAMDVARTAIRKGSRFVTVYCRNNTANASALELDYTLADGVDIRYGMGIDYITSEGPMCIPMDYDEDGVTVVRQHKPILCEADNTIIAISQGPKDKIVSTTTGVETTDRGLVKVDENGQTTREGVFSAGDVVMGARNVVQAVRTAKEVAEAMDMYLRNKAQKQ